MLELPITSCSAALAAVLLTGLSLNVSRLRMRHRVSLGSGGHKALQLAVRAHGNALEQSLLFFLLLLIAEAQAHSFAPLAAVAGAFLLARGAHAIGMLAGVLKLRQGGHALTLLAQVALVVVLLTGL
ncbi:MAPEG family protein [Aquipseudomonas alcaligenes]|uniref:MAPEG family protein n=1 Tax=Pseudomonas solani TaxID=2731552 RepID=UPI003D6A36DE